jgi:hypothetical protein
MSLLLSRSWKLLARWWNRAGTRAAAVWSIVYLVVCATGQRFDTRYLGYGWQLIPWDVLSADPVRSVWYLHVQPPLWNLFLGGLAWMSPVGDSLTLQAAMAAIGVVGAFLAAELATSFGLSRRWAVVVALVATANPEVLKGAFEPTYELATGVLLMAVVLVLSRLGSMTNVRRGLLLLAALVTATTMTRSLYHPIWAIALVVLGLWLVRGRIDRRTVLAALAVPILVMGGWMAKNQFLFGDATLSSWFGMNLQRAVIPVLPRADLEKMHADGDVSEIAMIGPFGNYDLYVDAMPPCEPTREHRSLSEATRTTDQWSPNFNYECFLPIYSVAGDDALAVIREHPEVWVEGRMWSLRATFAVATLPAESESIAMRFLDSTFSIARLDMGGVLSTYGWGTPIYGQLEAGVDFGLVLIPLYAVLILAGARVLVRRLRRRTMVTNDVALVATSFTVAFTIVVGAVAELGEQARFRTMVDPLATVVGAFLISMAVRAVRSARQRQASSVGR